MVPYMGMARVTPSVRCLALITALAGFPTGTFAQSPDDSGRPVARGSVIDVHTQMPIPNAMVAFDGSTTMTLTDSLGRFVLRAPPAWEYRLSVAVLGYVPTAFDVGEEELERTLVVALRPDPIALEGLEILVDRFERRRRFRSGPVRTVDQAVLARTSGSTAFDVVRRQVGSLRHCPPRLGTAGDVCVMRRGRQEVSRICIDEMQAFRGMEDLETYLPSDLYLIEIYDRGLEIRVYTNWFVEQAMRERRRLRPLAFSC